jgi:hypothetical protein
MKDVTNVDEQLQDALIKAVEQHADISTIEQILAQGAVANDVRVMQAIEEHADKASQAWGVALFNIPVVADAWRLREAADQAALDLIECLEENDLDGVKDALEQMADAGDNADMDMGEGSLLAIAIQNQCDLKILDLLMGIGKADPTGFSNDAVEALEDVEEGPWKTKVEALFQRKGVKLSG